MFIDIYERVGMVKPIPCVSNILNWLSQSDVKVFSVWCMLCGVAEWPAACYLLGINKNHTSFVICHNYTRNNLFKNVKILVHKNLMPMLYAYYNKERFCGILVAV
jgi:hypothetical protein